MSLTLIKFEILQSCLKQKHPQRSEKRKVWIIILIISTDRDALSNILITLWTIGQNWIILVLYSAPLTLLCPGGGKNLCGSLWWEWYRALRCDGFLIKSQNQIKFPFVCQKLMIMCQWLKKMYFLTSHLIILFVLWAIG